MVATAYKRSPQIGFVALGTLPGSGGGSTPVVAAGSLQVLLTNGDAGNHVIGNLVYLSAASTVRLAVPNGTAAQAAVYAMAIATVAPAATAYYLILGQIAGVAGGSLGAIGFLDTTSLLTTVVPSVAGRYSTQCGIFQSTTIFNFNPQVPLGPL